MPAPIVHFELRSHDPDARRAFFGDVFGWRYAEGAIAGYTYVDTGVEGSIPGGIGPVQGGEPMTVFFVGLQTWTKRCGARRNWVGARSSRQPACQASRSASWPTRKVRWWESLRGGNAVSVRSDELEVDRP